MPVHNHYIEVNEPIDVLWIFSPRYEHNFMLHSIKWRGVKYKIKSIESVMFCYDRGDNYYYFTPERYTCHCSMIAQAKDYNKSFILAFHLIDLNWTLSRVSI